MSRATFVTNASKWKTGSNFPLKGLYTYDGTVLNDDESVQKRDGYTFPLPKKDQSGLFYIYVVCNYCLL